MIPYLTDKHLAWRDKLKLRSWVVVVGVPLAVWGAIAVGPGWLAWPLVGVAVAAVTMAVNRVGGMLSQKTCWTCGGDLSSSPACEQGVVCEECGALNQFNPDALALGDEPIGGGWPDADEEADEGEAAVTERARA